MIKIFTEMSCRVGIVNSVLSASKSAVITVLFEASPFLRLQIGYKRGAFLWLFTESCGIRAKREAERDSG